MYSCPHCVNKQSTWYWLHAQDHAPWQITAVMSSCHRKAPKPAADAKGCMSWWACRLPLLPVAQGRHTAQSYTNLMTRSPLRPTSHLTCQTSRDTWVQSKNCSAYEPNIAGPPGWKQRCGRGPGSELEPTTCPHSKEGHQHPKLHKLH